MSHQKVKDLIVVQYESIALSDDPVPGAYVLTFPRRRFGQCCATHPYTKIANENLTNPSSKVMFKFGIRKAESMNLKPLLEYYFIENLVYRRATHKDIGNEGRRCGLHKQVKNRLQHFIFKCEPNEEFWKEMNTAMIDLMKETA